VWRKICVPNGISFENLHEILQLAFGWEDEHAHDFTFPASKICIVQDEAYAYGIKRFSRPPMKIMKNFIRIGKSFVCIFRKITALA
jgi:hypothetical protein